MQYVIVETLTIIQQQKAELLKIKAEQLEAATSSISNNIQTSIEIESETVQLIEEVKAVEKEVENIELNTDISVEPKTQTTKKRFGMKQKILKAFNVEKESMDDEQLDLIGDTIDKSMIVAGCAGSGKSVIAMYKAQQILESKGDVILIAYTKSLNRYMRQGKENSLDERFFYHWQWIDQGMPKADYIIVDEIQDFDREEIMQFINAARKCFFFFGDTAQS